MRLTHFFEFWAIFSWATILSRVLGRCLSTRSIVAGDGWGEKARDEAKVGDEARNGRKTGLGLWRRAPLQVDLFFSWHKVFIIWLISYKILIDS